MALERNPQRAAAGAPSGGVAAEAPTFAAANSRWLLPLAGVVMLGAGWLLLDMLGRPVPAWADGVVAVSLMVGMFAVGLGVVATRTAAAAIAGRAMLTVALLVAVGYIWRALA